MAICTLSGPAGSGWLNVTTPMLFANTSVRVTAPPSTFVACSAVATSYGPFGPTHEVVVFLSGGGGGASGTDGPSTCVKPAVASAANRWSSVRVSVTGVTW